MPKFVPTPALQPLVASLVLAAAAAQAVPLQPTAAEQYMLELINRGRANPWAEAVRLAVPGGNPNEGLTTPVLANGVSLAPLAMNLDLVSVSRGYSQAVLDADSTSTHFLNNTVPGPRMRAGGYNADQSKVAENITLSYAADPTGNPSEYWANRHYRNLFLDSGLDGRGHRMTMLTTSLREVGIGYATATGYTAYSTTKTNGIMVTQDFGYRSAAPSFLTGVVYDDAFSRNSFYNIGEGLGGIQVNVFGVGGSTLLASTTTWDSGGYTLALAPGAYDVEFRRSSDGLAVRQTISGWTADNRKLDGINPFNAPLGPQGKITNPGGDIFDDTPAIPVPEPGTYALMACGVLLVGAAARRNRRRA